MKKKDIKIKAELHTRIQEALTDCNGFNSEQYSYIEDQLEFSSGNQWEEDVADAREADQRPMVVINTVRPKINKIVNALRMNPLGIRVETPDEELTTLLSGVIKDVEEDSRAKEAYDVAYENAVTGGLGWMHIEAEYKDDYSSNLNVKINQIDDPTSVWIDPYSRKIDGSDATYGFLIKYRDAKKAEEEFGEDATGDGFSGIDIYTEWNVPSDNVPELIFYEIVEEKSKRYWIQLADGVQIIEEDDYNEFKRENIEFEVVNEREVTKKICMCYHFVGQKLIESIEYPMPYIPLIPVFGDRVHMRKSKNIRWVGMVHWAFDTSRIANMYASNELELAALAPISQWLVAEGQTSGYEDIWANANTNSYASMPYVPVSLSGVQVPPPMRIDNTAQTGPLIQSRNAILAQQDEILGFNNGMMGQAEGASESGQAVLLRQNAGEVTTAQYIQNMSQSIAQCGRILLYMLAYTHDTDREVGIRDENENRTTQSMNLSEILTPQLLEELRVQVTAGPAYAGKTKEAQQLFMQVATIVGPEKASNMADIIVRESGAVGARALADRLEKMLPEQLKDGAPPNPEMLQALENGQQTMEMQAQQIEQLNGFIQQLSAKLEDGQADRESKERIAMINAEAKIQAEIIEQTGEDSRLGDKLEADALSEITKIATQQ